MGKGGTKFVGDAVGVRSGKGKVGLSRKDMQDNMKKFLETGVHPEIERSRQANASLVQPLPDPDTHRPHVFLDVTIAGRPAGRLIIELFDDLAPAAAARFKARCMPGATASVLNASFHRVVPFYGAFAAKDASAADGISLQQRGGRLQHSETGAVSISHSGDEIAIALARAVALDSTHQVVGRVALGRELLDQFNELPRLPDDTPTEKVRISRCGASNAQGVVEEAPGAESKEQAAQRLAAESAEARSAVLEALEVGLSGKRPAPAPAPGRNVKPKKAGMLDSMLQELSDSDGSGSSSSGCGSEGGEA